MMPIQDLLNRIRWDRDFGQARFELGYYDRFEKALVRVPPEKVSFSEGEHFFLEVVAPDGAVHSVPRHRVRAVWRDGVFIWRR